MEPVERVEATTPLQTGAVVVEAVVTASSLRTPLTLRKAMLLPTTSALLERGFPGLPGLRVGIRGGDRLRPFRLQAGQQVAVLSIRPRQGLVEQAVQPLPGPSMSPIPAATAGPGLITIPVVVEVVVGLVVTPLAAALVELARLELAEPGVLPGRLTAASAV